MEITHICTTDSLRAGMEDILPMECWLCGCETMRLDWAGGRCDTCGADVGDAAWSLGAARKKAKIRRRDFAAAMGVKPTTVTTYEWCGASIAYIERCRSFFHGHYGA